MIKFEDIPRHILDKMLYYQKQQGNKVDVEVFKRRVDASRTGGGFNWDQTPEGTDYWSRIINKKIIPDAVKEVEEDVYEVNAYVLAITNDYCAYLEKTKETDYLFAVLKSYNVVDTLLDNLRVDKMENKWVELTLEDISNGKGVGVPKELIKIVDKHV